MDQTRVKNFHILKPQQNSMFSFDLQAQATSHVWLQSQQFSTLNVRTCSFRVCVFTTKQKEAVFFSEGAKPV